MFQLDAGRALELLFCVSLPVLSLHWLAHFRSFSLAHAQNPAHVLATTKDVRRAVQLDGHLEMGESEKRAIQMRLTSRAFTDEKLYTK